MRLPSMRGGLLLATLFFVMSSGPAMGQLKKVDVKFKEYVETERVRPGDRVRAALEVRLPKGFHVNSDKPLEEHLIPTALSFEPVEGVGAAEIVYPKALLLKVGGAPEPVAVFAEHFFVGIVFEVSKSLPDGEYVVKGHFRYQACNDKSCFFPVTQDREFKLKVAAAETAAPQQFPEVFGKISFSQGKDGGPTGSLEGAVKASGGPPDEAVSLMSLMDQFKVLGTASGIMDKGKFLDFVESSETGQVKKGVFEDKGPLAIVLLVLIGGLALNLTPCVLPLIPINLAIIGAGAEAKNRAQGFALGGTYGLGMALTYGILGLVVILTAGTFGALNASPWFNLVVAALFIVLALGMFDVIPIDFSHLQSKFNFGANIKGNYFVAFGMGAVAALLAGACVAPVVIQVIVFSSDLYVKGTVIALALPFLLGLGMALPWPVAGAGLSALPRPGAWMVRVKQAFGVFILGFSAYYGYLAFEIIHSRLPEPEAGVAASTLEPGSHPGWTTSLDDGLQEALREDEPVLIDLWATWCKNCTAMDKTTLGEPEVLERLDGYVKVKFQAENPEASPVNEVMRRLGAMGLPFYAILKPSTSADSP